jgi:predicted dehydrogenase
MVSQIAFGVRNHLRLRIYGSEGALDWCQENPNDLRILEADGTERIVHVSPSDVSAGSAWATRLPSGHPEGFMEAFANVYRAVAADIRGRRGGGGYDPRQDYPTVQDGARGVHFIHAAVRSAREGCWVDASYTPPGTSF